MSDLTAMNVDVYPDLGHGIVKISGQALRRMKSTGIAEILEEEAEFLLQTVHKYIRATDELEFQNQSG